jgi:hypothetical protein
MADKTITHQRLKSLANRLSLPKKLAGGVVSFIHTGRDRVRETLSRGLNAD